MTDRRLPGLNVSRETLDRLAEYEALLRKWNPKINLVSPKTLENAWERHFADSAQIYALKPGGVRKWVDLGSGGGFPGLVVATIAAELDPNLHVVLVESDQRKSTFLRTVARELSLNVTVHPVRAESLEPQGADVLSARAFAPLAALFEHCERHLAPAGTAIFPKGEQYEKEYKHALESWRFEVHKVPSRTDSNAVILSIKGLSRA